MSELYIYQNVQCNDKNLTQHIHFYTGFKPNKYYWFTELLHCILQEKRAAP